MERKAKSSTFFTQVDIKFPISLCHQKMKKPSNIFHKIRLFLLSTVAEEKITVSYTLEPAKLYICLCCRMWNRQFRFELFFGLAFRAEVLFEFYFRYIWTVSCDVSYPEVSRVIDDARVAGCYILSVFMAWQFDCFKGKVISVLITELTTPSPSNQLKTLQRIWIFRCKFAPRSRVHSSPRNPRHSALRCIYSAACTAIAFRNEKKNMSCNFSGEVKWPASGIPGIC